MDFAKIAFKAAVSFFGVLRCNPVPAVAVAVIGLFGYLAYVAGSVIAAASAQFPVFVLLVSLVMLGAITVLWIVSIHKPQAQRK